MTIIRKKISELTENDCGTYKGQKFIVLPYQDRGETEILMEDGSEMSFRFENPEIEYIGVGSIKRIIKWPNE